MLAAHRLLLLLLSLPLLPLCCAGFAAVDALFGQRKVVVKDTFPLQQSQPQPQPYQQRPASAPLPAAAAAATAGSSYAAASSPLQSASIPSSSSSDACIQAVGALSDCESRNGYGSDKCRFFRIKADECQRQQAAFFSAHSAEQR